MNPMKIDERRNKYRDCHIEFCEGKIQVYVRVKMANNKFTESDPWIACSEAHHCGFVEEYKAEEWG